MARVLCVRNLLMLIKLRVTDKLAYSYLGFDLANRTVTIQGDGNARFSTTSYFDVARFVAHVLTTLPLTQIEGATFRLEGDRVVRFLFVYAIW
jgi:hypothetical protein